MLQQVLKTCHILRNLYTLLNAQTHCAVSILCVPALTINGDELEMFRCRTYSGYKKFTYSSAYSDNIWRTLQSKSTRILQLSAQSQWPDSVCACLELSRVCFRRACSWNMYICIALAARGKLQCSLGNKRIAFFD